MCMIYMYPLNFNYKKDVTPLWAGLFKLKKKLIKIYCLQSLNHFDI